MFEKADKILDKALNKRGLSKTALSARICFEAEREIAQFFPKLKSQINVESYTRGVLKISSKNAIINQEIQLKKQVLIKKINQKVGSDLVEDLRFGIR